MDLGSINTNYEEIVETKSGKSSLFFSLPVSTKFEQCGTSIIISKFHYINNHNCSYM
jgi:hypothetical protein